MLGSLVSAVAGPLTGRWMDTRGAREVILTGSVLACAALLVTSRAEALWQVGVGWGVVSIARTMVFPVPYSWLLTRWFSARRQMALGMLTIGFGIAGVGVLPLSMIEERWDWSAVMVTTALLILLVNGLLALLLIHDRPANLGLRVERMTELEAQATTPETAGFTVGEALRSPAFWLLAGAFMTFFIAPATFSTLQLDFFQTSGVEQAALLVAIGASVRGFSRLPFGLLLGRIRRTFLLAVVVAITQVAALSAVVISTAPAGLVVFVLMWGLGGAFVPMLEPILINRTFGTRQFGTITGAMMMLASRGRRSARSSPARCSMRPARTGWRSRSWWRGLDLDHLLHGRLTGGERCAPPPGLRRARDEGCSGPPGRTRATMTVATPTTAAELEAR